MDPLSSATGVWRDPDTTVLLLRAAKLLALGARAHSEFRAYERLLEGHELRFATVLSRRLSASTHAAALGSHAGGEDLE